MKNLDFQDHYAILGVEMKTSSEEIARVYQALANEYHPNTPRTGDRVKFDRINAAYEVLSDPAARAAFDKLFEGPSDDRRKPHFTGAAFFEAMKMEGKRRTAILCVLYDHRRHQSAAASITFRELEGLLTMTGPELNFSLWFLKQRGLAVVDDKSSIQITVDGMEYLERQPLDPAEVQPFIRTVK